MNEDKKIVGIGYNGMPNKCSDDSLPWNREAENKLDTKYPYGMVIIMFIKNMVCTPSVWYINYSRLCNLHLRT